jgi:hypothetical protein
MMPGPLLRLARGLPTATFDMNPLLQPAIEEGIAVLQDAAELIAI